jgi:two-component system, OmpR family, sensor histidine kinase QseC
VRLGRSLQLRLLVLLSVAITVVWLAVAVWAWVDARHEVDELMDSHLAQAAAILVVQPFNMEGGKVPDAPALQHYSERVAFQVFHDDVLVVHSAQADTEPLGSLRSGFETVLYHGDRWRVFAARDADSDVQVYVGEAIEARNSIVLAMLRGMLTPMVLALPLLVALMWWVVRRGLLPLRVLSRTLGLRKPQALNPVVVPDVPAEMRPLVAELNGLLARIGSMVEVERRFTADAAHELRTPIAAIRAQAQVALGAGSNTAQRDLALRTTLAGCDRAAHLVDQLLALARLESGSVATDTACNVSALVRQVAADLAPAALGRGQDLALEADMPCAIAANGALVNLLVRNLLDNALRYSPDGARVLVRVATTAQGIVALEVHDSGPGMAPSDRQRLGERFFRVLGHTQPGSGLGWSIVRRIAEVSGARVEAQASVLLGGLWVRVEWPGLGK